MFASKFVEGNRFLNGFLAAVCGVLAVASSTISFTMEESTAGAFASYILWIGAGIGIGLWRSKRFDNKIVRSLAVLTFPFFCWFPLVAYFSTTALLRFLPWQNVALTWFIVIVTCTALWLRGQQLDYQSRNPLQGLIPNPKEAQGISLKKSKKGLLYK